MQFDWSITLGNVISVLLLLVTMAGGVWKLRAADLRAINEMVTGVKNEVLGLIAENTRFLKETIARHDLDIREIRSRQFYEAERGASRRTVHPINVQDDDPS